MESIFDNPKAVEQLIRKGMDGKLEEGELDQVEVDQLTDALSPPSTPKPGPPRPVELRGEGGSGEPKKGLPLASPPPSTLDEEIQWARGEPAGDKGEWQEDREEHEASGTTSCSDQFALLRKEIADLKIYLEEQAQTFNSILTPLQTRVQRLEAESSPSIPLAVIPGGHARTASKGGTSPPPRPVTRSGVGVPRAGSAGPVVSRSQVEAFLLRNRDYPSLKPVRAAKLKMLQVGQGLPFALTDVSVSKWNVDGLYEALRELHEG